MGYLESVGVHARSWAGGSLSNDDVLIAGPGSGRILTADTPRISEFLRSGGNLLAVGLDDADAKELLPFKITMRKAEHISSFFEPFGVRSLLAGIGPADVHNRDPREFSLVAAGARVVGDGVLAKGDSSNLVFLQMTPWQFSGSEQANLRWTARRVAVLFDRLLANLGVADTSPVLERLHRPVDHVKAEKRWLGGLYLDQPEEWDDPYRFFRW